MVSVYSLVLTAVVITVEASWADPVIDDETSWNRPIIDDIVQTLDASERRDFRELVAIHTAKIAPDLNPALRVLPKNEQSKLAAPAVCYVLYRFFLQQRGWRVEGLDPEGAAWSKSSLEKVVALNRLPNASFPLLTNRLNGPGFTEDEVRFVAAMVEIFVHAEAVERLEKMFRIVGFKSPMQPERATEGLEYYMTAFLIGADLSSVSPKLIRQMHDEIPLQYPAWPETKKFIHEVASNNNIISEGHTMVDLTQVSGAVEQITDRYGRWQNYECLALKKHLLEMEDQGTGRVRLADFYSSALNTGKFQFTESVSYLRELGALDESNPSNLKVIIPNYVNGASNCVGSTKYGSLCCISECWSIFEQLEAALGAAEATPKDIMAAVTKIASATVPSNRTLSPLLLIRLQSAAASHDGIVPLHGRLFAQWLHHAYPRECDFPHRAGTTQPKDLYDMEAANDTQRIVATPEEMKQRSNVTARRDAPLETMAWSHEEELLHAPPHQDQFRPVAWLKIQVLATCAAIVTMVMGLMRTARMARRTVQNPSQVARPKSLYAEREHMHV